MLGSCKGVKIKCLNLRWTTMCDVIIYFKKMMSNFFDQKLLTDHEGPPPPTKEV